MMAGKPVRDAASGPCLDHHNAVSRNYPFVDDLIDTCRCVGRVGHVKGLSNEKPGDLVVLAWEAPSD